MAHRAPPDRPRLAALTGQWSVIASHKALTIRCDRPVVRYGRRRRRWAAGLYVTFGVLVATIAAASASAVLVAAAAFSFVLAAAALHPYPVERDW
jgi:hypothetical protein